MGAPTTYGRTDACARYRRSLRYSDRSQPLSVSFPLWNDFRMLTFESGPGSSLFLFEGKQTVNAGDSAFRSPFVGSSRVFRYLHCGDFRASPQHVLHPAVKGKQIDTVYLDTTYLDPKVSFPMRHGRRYCLQVAVSTASLLSHSSYLRARS